jgi:ATP-dependent RNA helicase DeaD
MNASSSDAPEGEPTFDLLPLGADVRRAVDALGYKHPTPVQRAVFEPAVQGRNLVVQARTGTGKTAAFGLPLADRIVRPSVKAVQALILCPTRELALQVAREVEQLSKFRGLSVVAIYGGAPMTRQVSALEAGAQIVAGTPGRVLDHLRQRTLDPSGIRVLVLDEADEMLSMGFARELHAILEALPKQRQGLFFSATVPPDIERLAHSHLKDPEFITLSSDQVGALEVNHYVYVMQRGDKIAQLIRILDVEDPESALIFCNTRDETQRVADTLKNRGFDADWLNGDLPQSDRERVMSATREGRLRFLVATDVAARGIDISHLTHVINHDFPETAEQYVHRTGRTGRAGRTGTAISIVGPTDIGNLYLLRLTYKIRPIQKQIPSDGELKTRAELDVVQLFVDAFARRPVHPEDLALARRLLTHDDAENIMAGLLRDHLGARGGDAVADATEARRARDPQPAVVPAPNPCSPSYDSGASTVVAKAAKGDATDFRANIATRSSIDVEGASRHPSSSPEARRGSLQRPVAELEWHPPMESDDERPILETPTDTGPALAPDSPASNPDEESDLEYLQIFVNIGRRERVRISDLQKLLVDAGIHPNDVGRIRVRDRMSYVGVKKEAFDRAVVALAGQVIGGRTVVAERAKIRS